MVSLGPLPISLVLLLSAFAIAAATGWKAARSPAQLPVRVTPTLIDMLFVGVVSARIGFVLQWLPAYMADPWSILRPGDGGFNLWVGIPAGLAFGVWRTRKLKPLRRPLVLGASAGLASWALLAGGLTLMQQSVLKLPSAELTTLEGTTTRLPAMSGKPMVVNLWATWCPPCRREMPVLRDAQMRHGDVSFAFVNQGESEQIVREYLRDGNLQLRNVLLDPFSATMQEAGSRGLPTTLFFDASGRLVDTHMGELSEAGLMQKLKRFGPAVGPAATPFTRETP